MVAPRETHEISSRARRERFEIGTARRSRTDTNMILSHVPLPVGLELRFEKW